MVAVEVEEMIPMILLHHIQERQGPQQPVHQPKKGGALVSGQVLHRVLLLVIWLVIEDNDKHNPNGTQVGLVVGGAETVAAGGARVQVGRAHSRIIQQGMKVPVLGRLRGDRMLITIEKIVVSKTIYMQIVHSALICLFAHFGPSYNRHYQSSV